MKMINIGCGSSCHKDWVNIDLVPKCSGVVTSDLTKGLPFDSHTFDVCYSSHVLEHLREDEGDYFIKEQKRILKQNGAIRVVVPDLEMICRNYLEYLEKLVAGSTQYEFSYDYSLLELFDQTTRDRSGGDMLKLWASEKMSDHDMEFIIARHGKEAEDAIAAIKKNRDAGVQYSRRIRNAFSEKGILQGFNRARSFIAESVVAVLLGKKAADSLREGIFRNSGEIHRMMYDRYNLKRLLLSHGFSDVAVCEASESRIADFNEYQLDVIDHVLRKPDSLFMEASCL